MNRGQRTWWRTSFVGCTLLLVLAGFGLAGSLEAQEDGPTARAVRLSDVEGQVQLLQNGQEVTGNALANTPLFEGARLVTGNDGRAEVQFEDGSVARISPDSSLTISALKPDGDTEVLLEGGLGYFELQGDEQGRGMRVRFGDDLVTGGGYTVLRVTLDQPPGELAVFSGNAHLDGPANLALDLHGGQSVKLNASDPDNPTVADSIEPDSWDAWNADRDQALAGSQSGSTDATNNLPDNNNPAWGDLNQNGSWYNVPDQGYVWSPYEASTPGWDPYGTGSWMPEPGFGYIWISAEPWGYMPYQCGTWNYYNSFGWGWAPGGCQTWWRGGGWGFNVGNYPRWYHLPNRPIRPPSPWHARPGGPVRVIGPVIRVNRSLPAGNTLLPARDPNASVLLGGTLVRPLRPLPVRPRFDHEPVITSRPLNGVQPRNTMVMRPGYNGPRPGNSPGVMPPVQGIRPMPSPRPVPMQPQRPVFPNAGRPMPPAVSRPAPPQMVRPAPMPAPRAAPPAPAPHAAPSGGPHR